jgi:hypothetical protein
MSLKIRDKTGNKLIVVIDDDGELSVPQEGEVKDNVNTRTVAKERTDGTETETGDGKRDS